MAGLVIGGLENSPFGITEVARSEVPSVFWHEDTPLGINEVGESILDTTAQDAGNTDGTRSIPTTLRAGLVLGRVRATGKYKHWNPTATDGSETAVGFLYKTSTVAPSGVVTENMRANGIAVYGRVLADQIIIPGQSARGIDGNDYEFLLVKQLRHQFNFGRSDRYGFPGGKSVRAAADITLTDEDNNALITNGGATGAVTVTLPTPKEGMHFQVLETVSGQALTIAGSLLSAGTAETSIAADQTLRRLDATNVDGSVVWVVS